MCKSYLPKSPFLPLIKLIYLSSRTTFHFILYFHYKFKTKEKVRIGCPVSDFLL